MINAWTISLYQAGSEASFASLVLGVFYLDMTLLGAWSALYYAINFFLQVEEQADRLERLEAQATGAQHALHGIQCRLFVRHIAQAKGDGDAVEAVVRKRQAFGV